MNKSYKLKIGDEIDISAWELYKKKPECWGFMTAEQRDNWLCDSNNVLAHSSDEFNHVRNIGHVRGNCYGGGIC